MMDIYHQQYKERMNELNKTIEYYNTNAKEFVSRTILLDLGLFRKMFTDRLAKKSVVLDFGCGSGRDTKYFLSQGYQVDAIDGSVEQCKLASEYTGIEVKNVLFNEFSWVQKYDGIWACSSILHLPLTDLSDVVSKMVLALKKNGIIFTNFKYGTFIGERNGRHFTDMTEETFSEFIKQIEDVTTEEVLVSLDKRPGKTGERWLNLILRKTES